MKIRLYLLVSMLSIILIGCNNQLKYYEVVFINHDETIISTQTVQAGSSAVAPEDPIKDGFNFIEWDQDFDNVTKNLEIRAIFEEIQIYYSVTFTDGEVIISTQSVLKGESAIAPLSPSKDGYTFIGWDQDFDNITIDLEVKPIFEEIKIYYNVTFIDGDIILSSQNVLKETSAIVPLTPQKDGYTFIGWDQEFDIVTTDLEINAIFEIIITYTVTFIDDTNIISIQTVIEGAGAIVPLAPSKQGFNFIGWDQAFDNVTTDLEIRAIFEVVKVYYIVIFVDGTVVLSSQGVLEGESAIAPDAPNKEGFKFVEWDQSFDVVMNNLVINAIYEEIILDPNERIQYTSYIDEFNFNSIITPQALIDNMDFSKYLVNTITNIFHGGFRGTNQLHYYDITNISNRNIYGFEVAVGQNGVVVSRGTLVDLPDGGFILSGHGTSATTLETLTKIGDIIIYNGSIAKTASVYRSSSISNVIALNVLINTSISKVNFAFYTNCLALDYQRIVNKMNAAIDIYNQLVDTYTLANFNQAKGLLLDVDFLLVETYAVETKAFWHYPTRAGSYLERNVGEVQAFLKQVSHLGFNTIYVNTNFGGRSIYKSDYLEQSITTNNTYTGYKDYLECFVEEAHKLNIRVIAWTNTLIAGDGFITKFYTDRQWVLTSYNGANNNNGMYFLDISNPDVQTFLVNVYTELASNYRLDGIEYDFIRYPSGNLHTYSGVITSTSSVKDWGYNDNFVALFMEANQLTGDFKTLINESATIRTNWLNFKRELLNDTVETLTNTIRSARPGIAITAAVMSSINTARNTYLQDWDNWIDNDWVDILEPMIYSGDANYVLNTLKTMYEFVNHRAEIVVGIFPEGDGADSGVNAEQISLITQKYNVGWSKFSGRTIFNNSLFAHSVGMMSRAYTSLPSDPKDKIFKSYIYELLDKVENFYQYIDLENDYTVLISILEAAYLLEDVSDDVYLLALNEIKNELESIKIEAVKDRLINKHAYIHSLIQ